MNTQAKPNTAAPTGLAGVNLKESPMNQPQPTLEQVLAKMTASLNGQVPNAVTLAATVMPELVLRHAADSAFAMPAEGGALDNETRTLIYLGIALATGSRTCTQAMTNKALALNIDRAKVLETLKIARFAEASRVLGDSEYVLAKFSPEAR